MKYRKGVFCVVYKKTKSGIKYLVLHRKLHWVGWEFIKGGLKSREKKENAVAREVKEEIGYKIKNMIKFNLSGKYRYNKKLLDRKQFLGQTYNLFAVEADDKKIKLDKKEHDNYKWLKFSDAYKILSWPNQKKCLKIVDIYINSVK